MKIGYARVSTNQQNCALQIKALKEYGCEKIYTEKISGKWSDRPELNDLIKFIREGDTLIVWKLDRLGRSLQHLVKVVNELNEKKVNIVSLQEHLDTSSPTGKLVFHLFCALAEFERENIVERSQAGLAIARTKGIQLGRPKLISPEIQPQFEKLAINDDINVTEKCKILNISRMTYYRSKKNLKPAESASSD